MEATRLDVRYEPVAGLVEPKNGNAEVQFVAVRAAMDKDAGNHSKKFLYAAACAG